VAVLWMNRPPPPPPPAPEKAKPVAEQPAQPEKAAQPDKAALPEKAAEAAQPEKAAQPKAAERTVEPKAAQPEKAAEPEKASASEKTGGKSTGGKARPLSPAAAADLDEAEAALAAGKPADALRLAQHSLYAQRSGRAYAVMARAVLRAGRSRQRQGGAGAGRSGGARPGGARLPQVGNGAAMRTRAIGRVLGLVLVAGVVLGAAAPARADSPVEPGKVFTGDEGLTVAIVPLRPRADGKVLVQVTGSGGDFDGKVIPHKVTVLGDRKSNFATTYHGRDWVTIAVRDSWWEAQRYSLGLPGRRDDPVVRFDDQKTKALKADDVYKLYQKQQADGTLKALATFDRKAETAAQEKQLARVTDEFAKGCGAKLALKVTWASITDDDVKDLSIASFCGEPVTAMREMCEQSNEAKKAISAQVKSLVCTMGKSMKLDLQGATLEWTTSRDASNVGDFTKQYLNKKL
jgi:hypothetical protein